MTFGPFAVRCLSTNLALALASAAMSAWAVAALQSRDPSQRCGGADAPCPILAPVGGQYYVALPAGWDGERKLGALLFFHGYKSSGREFITKPSVAAAAHRRGELLIALDGVEGSWSYHGSPSQRRDDIAYVRAVLDDVARRFPLDQDNLWAAGFSQGGSMAWEIACYMGKPFRAFVPISGSFWKPLPEDCPAGPVNMLHIHGTSDRTVPLMGRSIGPFRQGEVMKSWEIMKRLDQCPADPEVTRTIDQYACEAWRSCGSGRRLEICLHSGGHSIPPNWLDLAQEFLTSIPAGRRGGL